MASTPGGGVVLLQMLNSCRPVYHFPLLLLILLFSCPVFAQKVERDVEISAVSDGGDGDLSVGLVLSGGGAKGYAHIGVLRALEEAGVRVDYIGGTSMGAIVGGLYSAGYSADQLEQLLRSIDIMSELQDAFEREDRPIYEKLYEEKYLLGISLKNFGIQLPTALSDGQRVYNLFSHWTAGVGHVREFSKLPIPFLAVATDLETGEDFVIEDGLLPEAMRASAALPGLLSPYTLDGHLLTDGGVSNNYPAEEIKAKGVDFVLGISVEEDALTAGDINSIDKLLMQIAFFQANRRNIEQYEVTDLDVKPDLKGFSVVSFDDIDTLIAAGTRVGELAMDDFRAIAARQSGPRSQRDTSAAPIPEFLNVVSLDIAGNADLSDRQVLSFFGEDVLPGRISWEQFKKGITALQATGRYSAIHYSWNKRAGSKEEIALKLELEEAPEFGQRLRLGLHYDQVYRGNLLLNFTINDVLVDNSFLSLDFIGGNRFRFNGEYRVNRVNGMAFGLRGRRHFANVAFELEENMSAPGGLIFDQVDFRFEDIGLEAFWDIRQTSNSFTGIASELKYYVTKSDQLAEADSSDIFRLTNDLYFTPRAYLLYDKLDHPNYPLRGFRINAVARAIRNVSVDNREETNRWAFNGDLEFLGMLQVSKRTAFGLEAMAGGFLDQSSLPYRYYLGSNNRNLMNNFKPFPGLNIGEASGSALLMGDLFLRTSFIPGQFLDIGGRFANLDNPERLPSSSRERQLYAGYIGYGISSPLGPIQLSYAQSNLGGQLYFNLGYWF